MVESNLGQLFFRGGWVMWPLAVFSILSWAVILERSFIFLTLKPRLRRLGEELIRLLKNGDTTSATQLCESDKSLAAQAYLSTFENNVTRELAERLTERNRARMIGHLKKNLWILGTIGSASPFIGLLGTVVGIVKAFHEMAEKGAGGFSVVAAGISEALIATAAGLVVAIVSLLTYNLFVTVANTTLTNVKITQEELLDRFYRPATTT